MKKVLEGALLSIAHRILQMKDKEDVNVLYKEAKEVYEKLAVLKFYKENVAALEGLMTEEILEKQLDIVSRQEDVSSLSPSNDFGVEEDRKQMPADLIQEEDRPNVLRSDYKKEESVSHDQELEPEGIAIDKSRITEIPAHKINPELEDADFQKRTMVYENQFIETTFVDSIEDEEADDLIHSYLDQHEAVLQQNKNLRSDDDIATNEQIVDVADVSIQEAFIHPETAALDQVEVRVEDSFLGFDFGDVDFVRVDDTITGSTQALEADFVPLVEKEDRLPIQSLFEFEPVSVTSPRSINDSYNTTISIGLNDRIGFERHLFNGSSEDLNRVLSQLNTANSWEEAVDFIVQLVKPDYNNWEGKEDYERRFMELVEKRFV